MRAAVSMLCLIAIARSLAAQTPDLAHADLPDGVGAQLQALVDDPATVRYHGPSAIEPERTISGNVAVFDGSLLVAGRVDGQILVVDGDLVFEPGALVGGDVTVVGGSMEGAEFAAIGGTVTVYGEGFSIYGAGRRILASAKRDDRDRRWRDFRGGSELTLRVADGYNRVEGLPVQFGPDIWTGGPFPLRIEALGIWRSAAGGFDSREMGYLLRAEQFIAPRRALRVGASLRSTVQPIEAWTISDLEASLAAALFHDDLRDHFERVGWSAYVRLSPRRSPLDLLIEYRDERHGSVPVRDPWTLFDRDRLWRPQPLVAEGDVRLLSGSAELDFRRGSEFRSRGWLVRAEATHRLDGDLIVPSTAVALDPVPGARFDSPFTTVRLDARSFQPVGWDGVLALRAVAGGNTRREPLPPQFQHALGGPGTLPGYSVFAADCGARAIALPGAERGAVFPSYGCDRFALFQAEYRGGFDIRFGGGHDPREREHGWGFHVDASPNWIVFFDAARGWAYDEATALRADTGTLYDIGAGLILGGMGVYGAVPLNGDDRSLELFVRLGPRF